METLSEVGSTTIVPIPDPELYIMVNGVPTKGMVVWRSLVDINVVKVAFVKLKEINWLYMNVDDKSLEEATKVVETIDTTSNTMIEKATKKDIATFQSYTIRSLDQQHSITADTDQYKMLNVKEIPLNSRQEEDAQCVEMGSSIEEHISNTSINEVNSWATTNEMSALAHLLKCNIYSYGTINQTWEPRFPNHIDPGIIEDVTQKSLYIVHVHGNHFEVVTSQFPQ